MNPPLLDRAIRWRGLDPVSIEHCQIIRTARDTRIRGAVIGPDYGAYYRLKLDGEGHVRTVRVERTDGGVLELFSDGGGNWSDDRAEPLPALRGCIDIDLSATPLTNSLPLWRSDFVAGAPLNFSMAWINIDDLSVKPHSQIYTRLDETHFHYRSPDSGFARDLTVDADQLVIHYPDLFERIE